MALKTRRILLLVLLVASVVATSVFGQGILDGFRPTVSVVYHTNSSSILFDHRKHHDVGCVTCHTDATTSRRAADNLRPEKAACVGCHVNTSPMLNDCASCHAGYPITVDHKVTTSDDWMAVRPAPMKSPTVTPNLRFDHRRHVEEAIQRGAEDINQVCTTCHVVSSSAPSADMPAEALCLSCHTGGDEAPNSCATCHPTGSTGRVATELSSDTTAGRPRVLKPANHTVDFIARHGRVARAQPDECASCHTEKDCATCHVEQMALPFSVHPPNYNLVHALDARAQPGTCTDCHRPDTFCGSCHAETYFLPGENSGFPPQREFHPQGWLDSSMPGNHGVMARRHIEDCASCHTEQDCITCHVGINPHPPEFVFDCGRWLRAQPQSCARCHTDMSPVMSMCR